MNSIYHKFKLFLIENNLVGENDKILLGISGGSDSIALLGLFSEFRKEFPLSICAAYVNYHLRGSESDFDEELVKKMCVKEEVLCYTLSVDKESFFSAPGTGIEEKARNIRYAYFEELRVNLGLSKISVAHTQDDLLETLLFNLIRGTSPEKFALSLPLYDERSKILRPLMNFSKEELASYNRDRNFEFRLDSSNKEDIYSRNRIRNKIVPEVEKVNPSFRSSLLRFREILRIEENFINREIPALIDGENVVKVNNSFLILKSFYIDLHDALKLRLIRRAREILLGNLRDLYYSQIIYIKEGVLKTENFKYSDKFIKVYIKGSWIIIKSKEEGRI